MTRVTSHLQSRLDRIVGAAQSESRSPSVTAAVFQHGQVLASSSAGNLDGRPDGTPADADTQYRIGSITKTFTAALVLQLRDEGLLDLTDRLEQHVPGTPIGQVTIAQLLSHTSGLQSETDGEWWERCAGGDFAALAPTLRLVARPGRRFHYSNTGFGVLAEVVARLRGQSWESALQERLLDPLGLTRTTPRPAEPHALGLARHPHADLLLPEPEHDAGAMAAAGQLWSTVADLATWGEFLRSGREGVLAADTVAEMREPVGLHVTPGAAWGEAHGLGPEVFNIDGRLWIGHGGSMPGFLAHLRVEVETGRGLVQFTNLTSGMSGTLLADLRGLAEAEVPVESRPWFADDSQIDRLELTGSWYWGTSPYTMTARPDGAIELRPAGTGRGALFVPTGVDEYRGTSGYYFDETLRVVRRDGLAHHLDLASFRFTRTPYDPTADLPGGVTGDWS